MRKSGVLVAVGILIVGIGIFYRTNEVPVSTQGPDSAEQTPAESFEILVTAVPISDFAAELTVSTDIPLPVEVMASLSIKGQSPTDIYIGVSRRVSITSDTQTILLDGADKNLPAGEYLAEVTFYPRWGAENGPAVAKSIVYEISGVADVELGGSGLTKDQADEQNTAQMWVIQNVVIGTQWDEQKFVQILGDNSKSEAELNLHDAYYFPLADMTIIVRRSDSTVAIWRMGRATK